MNWCIRGGTVVRADDFKNNNNNVDNATSVDDKKNDMGCELETNKSKKFGRAKKTTRGRSKASARIQVKTVDDWSVYATINILPCLQPSYWKHYNISIKELKTILSKLDASYIWQTLLYFFPDACIDAVNVKTVSTYLQSVYRFKFQQKSESIKIFLRCVSECPRYANLFRTDSSSSSSCLSDKRKMLETSIPDHIPYLPIVYVNVQQFRGLVQTICSSSLMNGEFMDQKTSLFRKLTYPSLFQYKFRKYVPLSYNSKKNYIELVRIISLNEEDNPLIPSSYPDSNVVTMPTYCYVVKKQQQEQSETNSVVYEKYEMMYEEMCFVKTLENVK